MKIAFLSYEYPIETGGGGIGTYLTQCIEWLPKFGHYPVVFCGTREKEAFWENENIFRFPCTALSYNSKLLAYFIPLHKSINFDIAEGTDFFDWGLPILENIESLPFCIKAHTSSFIIDKYLFYPLDFSQKIRFLLGAFKRGKWPNFPQPPKEGHYLMEKKIVTYAHLVISPSISLTEKYNEINWNNKFAIVPYPFAREFKLNYKRNDTITIVFFGRLEIRKGILDLITAIPLVLKKHPNVKFKLVGNPARSPNSRILMDEYISTKLKNHLNNLEILPAISNSKIDNLFSEGDVFVFPSLYDNFPLVCLEAMAAGKAVIGSNSGGMAEIIEENISGLLVTPKSPKELASKVCELIENESLRLNLGINAKKRIENKYHPNEIIPLQIATYQKLIDARR